VAQQALRQARAALKTRDADAIEALRQQRWQERLDDGRPLHIAVRAQQSAGRLASSRP